MPGPEEKEVAAPEKQTGSELDEATLNDVASRVMGEELYSEPETKAEEEPEEEPEAAEAVPEEEPEEEIEAEEDPESAEAVKDLTDEQKERIQKRMGKLTAFRKEAESSLTEAQGQLEAKDSEITDLEDRLESARKGGQNLPMAASLMQAATGKELDAELDKLESMIDWCEDHLDEGFESDNGDLVAPSEIRKRLRMFQKFEKRMVPKAKEALKQREAAQTDARKAYPDLFEKNTPSGQRYRRLVLDHPELKAIPDLPMLVGDALAGAALRQTPPKKQPKRAPATPEEKAAPKKAEITDAPKKQKRQADLGKVIDGGGSRDALAGAILDMDII